MGSVVDLIVHTILKKSMQLITAFICHKLRLRQQQSLVRKLGYLMFWVKPQRMYLVLKEDVSETCSSYSERDSESTLSSYQLLENPPHIECKECDQTRAECEDMKREIIQLQAQMSQIILKMAADEGNSCCEEVGGHTVSSSTTSSTILTPAETFQPPPPPPLPLPPVLSRPWATKASEMVKDRTGRENYASKRETKVCSIAEELSTKPPKLRHVERSPGGRPIRSLPKYTERQRGESDTLTAVLKKRFEAIHSP